MYIFRLFIKSIDSISPLFIISDPTSRLCCAAHIPMSLLFPSKSLQHLASISLSLHSCTHRILFHLQSVENGISMCFVRTRSQTRRRRKRRSRRFLTVWTLTSSWTGFPPPIPLSFSPSPSFLLLPFSLPPFLRSSSLPPSHHGSNLLITEYTRRCLVATD